MSNLAGNRLANESLKVFLQLLCPFAESADETIGCATVASDDGTVSMI